MRAPTLIRLRAGTPYGPDPMEQARATTAVRPRKDGDTMSNAKKTDTQSPALHVADSHDLIRVQGA